MCKKLGYPLKSQGKLLNESDIDKLILGESDKQLICKKLEEL